MTGNSENKQVNFMKYCWLCKYGSRKENMDPCNICLEVAMREGTEVPEYFEEDKHG